MIGSGVGYMKGSTDGGKHIEAMRTGRMKMGRCELRATGCRSGLDRLEKHHEKYRPERCIYVCHHCHHLLHFRPWQLTDAQKKQLLAVRHGAPMMRAFSGKPRVLETMLKQYVAPGRRPAQLVVRRKVREMAKKKKANG